MDFTTAWVWSINENLEISQHVSQSNWARYERRGPKWLNSKSTDWDLARMCGRIIRSLNVTDSKISNDRRIYHKICSFDICWRAQLYASEKRRTVILRILCSLKSFLSAAMYQVNVQTFLSCSTNIQVNGWKVGHIHLQRSWFQYSLVWDRNVP